MRMLLVTCIENFTPLCGQSATGELTLWEHFCFSNHALIRYQHAIPICELTFRCVLDMKTPRQLKRRVNSTPKKKHTQTTPKKCMKNSGLKESCLEHVSDTQSGNLTQPVPDLWLEAKMKAEVSQASVLCSLLHLVFTFSYIHFLLLNFDQSNLFVFLDI